MERDAFGNEVTPEPASPPRTESVPPPGGAPRPAPTPAAPKQSEIREFSTTVQIPSRFAGLATKLFSYLLKRAPGNVRAVAISSDSPEARDLLEHVLGPEVAAQYEAGKPIELTTEQAAKAIENAGGEGGIAQSFTVVANDGGAIEQISRDLGPELAAQLKVGEPAQLQQPSAAIVVVASILVALPSPRQQLERLLRTAVLHQRRAALERSARDARDARPQARPGVRRLAPERRLAPVRDDLRRGCLGPRRHAPVRRGRERVAFRDEPLRRP